MSTRRQIIQRVWQQIGGGIIQDDSQLTEDLIGKWLNDGIGLAVQQNYIGSIKLDGVSYINNSFATTFSGIAITADDIFTYRATLPQIPFALGQNEGIASLYVKSNSNEGGTGKSWDCIPLSLNQIGIENGRRTIPGRLQYYSEGQYIYVKTTGQDLSIGYTITVRLISGGDQTDLDSVLIIPDDYYPVIITYMQKQLGLELMTPQDTANDGNPSNSKM